MQKNISPYYGSALRRLLNELAFVISERNAYNKIWETTKETNWSFFSYASLALFNDMISHAMKVLDEHDDAKSFWFIYRQMKNDVEKKLFEIKIPIQSIECLSKNLKYIRDTTHMHIDRKALISAKMAWKDANIDGKNFNVVMEGLWQLLNFFYLTHFNEEFRALVYNGEDVPVLIDLAKQNGINV
jgi:hypothetical protein